MREKTICRGEKKDQHFLLKRSLPRVVMVCSQRGERERGRVSVCVYSSQIDDGPAFLGRNLAMEIIERL